MNTDHIIYVVLFLLFLIAAALFCSIETAFVSLQKLRLSHLLESQNPNAKVVARIISKPEKFLATVLLCINFFETAIATIGTLLAILLWGENLGAAIATIAVTILTLIFAELIPKSIAARHGEKIALRLARFTEITSIILYPFVFVLNHVESLLTGSGRNSADKKPTITTEEFHTAVNIGEVEGVWEQEEAEILHNVIKFANRRIKEIFTPRVDIIWIKKGTTLNQLFTLYAYFPHTKYPVFEGTNDNAIGVLFITDVIQAQANNTIQNDGSIDSLVRPAYFVPVSKLLGTLLADMKKNKHQVALVVDEYGGIAGMVTIDQLVVEIVGEIGTEIIDEKGEIISVDANTFQIDGGLRIVEANEDLGLNLPLGEYETIAGFIMTHTGRIPKQGEHLIYKDLELTILEMKGLKIERILVDRETRAAK